MQRIIILVEMKIDVRKLSKLILQLRTSKGYSQSYMAQRLAISQKAYSYLESGRSKMDLIRFLKIIYITESDPLVILKEITEPGSISHEHEKILQDLKNDINYLHQRIDFLQSHNDLLKKTIEKLLHTNQE